MNENINNSINFTLINYKNAKTVQLFLVNKGHRKTYVLSRHSKYDGVWRLPDLQKESS